MDALAARYNLRIARYLKSGAVFIVNAGQLEALRQDETQDHLSGDIRLKSSVDAMTAESIGADQVWAGSDDLPALSGAGVSVAVIDSGIDTRHAALRRRVLVTRDFTGGDGMDRFGHGTHVAAIIAGRAGRTADTRDQRGIAPGAYLLNLRVLGDDGSGSASDVIEAIDWTIEHRHEYNVRIINLSLGAPVMQPYRDDPLCEAVERAVRAGLVVVVAAGNYGRTAEGRDVHGRDRDAGQQPVRHHGRRARHARHGQAVGRHAGALQRQGPDPLRPQFQARRRRPRHPGGLGRSRRTPIWRGPTRRGTSPGRAPTRTSRCPAAAWLPGWSAARRALLFERRSRR